MGVTALSKTDAPTRATPGMPAAQAIKLKGHAYIMRFHNLGISFEKSKAAALVLVLELKANYQLNSANEANSRYAAKLEAFDKLAAAIKAF